jgi:ABC-2 type transport system ATP-binding protein
VLGAAIALALIPGSAQARDVIVHSFDGTPISAHFFPAPGLQGNDRAPTVMVGPGWGVPAGDVSGSDTDLQAGFGVTSAAAFHDAGYNVLTWDPRGFWESGGTVEIDSPDYEGRDAQALIDYIAQQPEAKLDGPGDPRLGMAGGSYGGGIQFVTAGLDGRVDAIAPAIAWNSQVSALFTNGDVKSGWGALLVGLGVATSTLPGVVSPAGIQTGHQDAHFYSSTASGTTTGTVSDDDQAWFASHGPDFLLGQIHAPTLIVQGAGDTLFTLDQAHRNFEALSHNGIPLRMMWFCGGHGICFTNRGEEGRIDKRVLAWMDRYLRGNTDADVGPTFEWIDENGDWHGSGGYPLNQVGTLEGTGSGQLPLSAAASGGSPFLIAATPAPVVVTADIDAPADPVNVLGEPKLDLTYSGLASPAQTFVYAQIVDPSRNVVVNNLATPIPVTLDGEQHELTLPLERIASLSTTAGYELQIAPGTSVYDEQRSTGYLDVSQAHVELPVSEPVGGGSGADCSNPQKGARGPTTSRAARVPTRWRAAAGTTGSRAAAATTA